MKCAIYIRVSTNKDEQKDSLNNQKNLFLNYITKNNYSLYKIYEDVGSGTSTKNRQGFQELCNDIRSKKIDLVLTKEISRLSRSTIDSGTFFELCFSKNVDIIATNNGIDTLNSNPSMLVFYSALAQFESELTSGRIKSSFEAIARSGKFKGAIAPYGYYVNNRTLKIRNDETPYIVKKIFKEYISGKGVDAIARLLNKENIPTPAQIANKKNAGILWHGSTVKLILENRNYTGDLTQCKSFVSSIRTKERVKKAPKDFITVNGTHEAIISKEEFEFVQELLISRSKKNNNNRKSSHLFSNILLCADCGKGMHYRKNRKGYVCGSYDKHGKSICSSHIIREADLENIILQDIKIISQNFKANYTNKISSKIKKEKLSLEKTIKVYSNKINSLNITKKNALLKLCSNTITDSEYRMLVDNITLNINELSTKINLLNEKLNKLNTLTKDDYLKISNELANIKKLNKNILNRLIKRIEIKETGDVRIFYRFSYLQSTL